MKKIYFALAVLATAALTSCQEEKSFNGVPIGKGDVAFVMQSGSSTRSADLGSPVTKGINVPIGRVGNMNIYLEETITDLDYVTPETRGVPVFTENVGTLYANKLFVHGGGDFGDATFQTDGTTENGWRFSHHYGDKDPWPENGSAVKFHLRMPSDMTGVTFGENAYTDGVKTTFTYTSPATAEAQADIIFTGIELDKATHDQNLPNGTPVTFYHALTAVKFALANTADEVENIQVTNISFTGLKNTGTCTVDPSATVHATWTNTSATTTTTGEGEQAVTKPNVIQQDFNEGDLVEFNSTNNPDFGSTFFNPAKPATETTPATPGSDTQNINTQTASKTFWLIPQKFDANNGAVLRISYKYNDNPEYIDLALNDILKDVEWKAGQLRTYRIRLDEVNVKIEDTVTLAGNAANGYTGSTKTNVVITNTGNTDAYIRAAIVGQWLDSNNDPVFGFTDDINNLYLVESWYEDQFVNGAAKHGEFTGLPGYKNGANPNANGWVLCTDGYYYYMTVVKPEATAEDPADAICKPLFTKYQLKTKPQAVEIAGEVLDEASMHFELEVATQAVSAKDIYGNTLSWQKAWERALGEEPVQK